MKKGSQTLPFFVDIWVLLCIILTRIILNFANAYCYNRAFGSGFYVNL